MQKIQPTIRTMTWEEAKEFGYQHQGLMLEHQCVTYRLSSGTKDEIHVYKSGPVLYVLTVNTHLDYVALDFYMGREQEPIDGIFLQGAWAISECVEADWRRLSLIELTTRLVGLFA